MDGLPAATSPPADSVYEAPAVLRLLCAERRSEDAGVTGRRAPAVQVALSAGLIRMLVLTAVILLLAVSGAITLLWLGYRRLAPRKLWR
jgi:hypothetical protein